MNKIYEKWWNNGNKVFEIINYKQAWKENGNNATFSFGTNGARKRKGNSCLDVHLHIGYISFTYTNFNLQKN